MKYMYRVGWMQIEKIEVTKVTDHFVTFSENGGREKSQRKSSSYQNWFDSMEGAWEFVSRSAATQVRSAETQVELAERRLESAKRKQRLIQQKIKAIPDIKVGKPHYFGECSENENQGLH